ncbi:MAG: hypothetical protein COX57_12880 [Alphaproteobacteria bacterium CG_4_10_14_0_2_um_filter_63_37]|nr:MAG: hypothetical protein AUJ55_11790 [Proteobacteria bacterium CG1_02_64_396]PJA23601.1 MAG: hypothetical protein COX57_12880 [Alphaproteobacteria bacterium CG_4_10_14_0_2_um_filter_63_37]
MNFEPFTMLVTSLDDEAWAQQIAATLIAERLAACVQVSGPVTSHYRWEGKQEQAREWLLTCKTPPERAADLVERLRALHPYTLPEIVVLQGQVQAAYGAWARGETT